MNQASLVLVISNNFKRNYVHAIMIELYAISEKCSLMVCVFLCISQLNIIIAIQNGGQWRKNWGRTKKTVFVRRLSTSFLPKKWWTHSSFVQKCNKWTKNTLENRGMAAFHVYLRTTAFGWTFSVRRTKSVRHWKLFLFFFANFGWNQAIFYSKMGFNVKWDY